MAVVVCEPAVESPVVEPVEVGHGLELDVVVAAPRASLVDELPLVEPVERLGRALS